MKLLIAILACIVIIGLAFYIGILLKRITSQKSLAAELLADKALKQQLSVEKRNQNIVDSIRFIATATMQKQCNISEAVIRITVLLETLQVEAPIDIAQKYPAFSSMYEKIKDMPTHEQRKKHPIKEIKTLDARRQLFEAEMEEAILSEAAELAEFTL